MVQKVEYTVLELIESTYKNAKIQPLNLGGVSAAGGGAGGPPGGYIGQLPQTRVAYDETEAAALDTPASGMSLVDNLNHIRYRLNILESGASLVVFDDNDVIEYADTTILHFSGPGVVVNDLGDGHIQVVSSSSGGSGTPLTVQEVDGVPSVTNVDKIIFSGAVVEDLGGGDVLVAIPSGGLHDHDIYSRKAYPENGIVNRWLPEDTTVASGYGAVFVDYLDLNGHNLVLEGDASMLVSDGISSLDVSFRAYRSASQTIPNATITVVAFDTETKDTHGFFDTANGKFTPLIPGTYKLAAFVYMDSLGDGKVMAIGFRKNGGALTTYWGESITTGAATSNILLSASDDFYFNGTTDYAEVVVTHGHGSDRNLLTGTSNTRFTGRLISSKDLVGV